MGITIRVFVTVGVDGVGIVVFLFGPVVVCEFLQQTNELFVHGHGIGICVILRSTLGPTVVEPFVIINPFSAH